MMKLFVGRLLQSCASSIGHSRRNKCNGLHSQRLFFTTKSLLLHAGILMDRSISPTICLTVIFPLTPIKRLWYGSLIWLTRRGHGLFGKPMNQLVKWRTCSPSKESRKAIEPSSICLWFPKPCLLHGPVLVWELFILLFLEDLRRKS